MTFTFEERTHGPDADGALAGELTRTHLEEEYWQPHAEQGDEVGDQECPWQVL